MPRRTKPFFHRVWWCTNVGGTRTKLAQGRENKDADEDALLALHNERRLHPVEEVADKFLDWIELHRAPDTYDDYWDWLDEWVKFHGSRIMSSRAVMPASIVLPRPKSPAISKLTRGIGLVRPKGASKVHRG
jgi:hypothetical protein